MVVYVLVWGGVVVMRGGGHDSLTRGWDGDYSFLF